MSFEAAHVRLRELLEQAAGALRAVPSGRFGGGLPEGLHVQELDRRGEQEAAPAEARIVSHRPHAQRYGATADCRLLSLTVEVRVVRTALLDAQETDSIRDALRSLAMADGDVIAEAFGWPPNLGRTEAGTETGLLALQHQDSTHQLLGTVGERQRFETVHRFVGMMRIMRVQPAGPEFTAAPRIGVLGGGDAVVGATLIYQPADVLRATGVTYQMLRDGVPSADAFPYETVSADEGVAFSVRATAIGTGAPVTSTSDPLTITGAVLSPPVLTAGPAVTGPSVGPGSTLVATPATWTGADSTSGTWRRDGVAIAGATNPAVSPDTTAEGDYDWRETATNDSGSVSATSNAISVVTPPPFPEGFPHAAVRHLYIAGRQTHDIAGAVLSIGDLSEGGGLHRINAARSPAMIESAPEFGGRAALQFSNSPADTRLQLLDQSGHIFVQQPTAGATLFFIWHKDSESTDMLFDTNNTVTTRTGWNVIHRVPAGELTVRIGRDAPSQASVLNWTSDAGSVPSGAHYAVVRLLTGHSPEWEVRVDGVTLASGAFATAPGTDVTSLHGMSVGGRGSTTTTTGLDGLMRAWGFYGYRISDLELAELETWLASQLT